MIDESEESRLLEKHASLLDRYSEAQRAIWVEMFVIGPDPATGLLRPRQSVGEHMRDGQFDVERGGDGFQSIGGRLEIHRAR